MFLAFVGRGHSEGPGKERKEGEERKRAFFFFFAPSFSKVRTAPSLLEPTVATSPEEKRRGRRPMKPFLLFPRLASSYPPSFLGQTKRERNGLFFVPIPFLPFHFLSWGVGRTFLSLFPFSSVRCRSSLWASVGCSGEGGRGRIGPKPPVTARGTWNETARGGGEKSRLCAGFFSYSFTK